MIDANEGKNLKKIHFADASAAGPSKIHQKVKKIPKRVCAVASTLYIHRTSVSCSIQCGVETAELKRDESYPRSYLP